MISDSILQWGFKKQGAFFHVASKKSIQNHFKILLPFPTTYLCEAKFSSYAEADMKIQLLTLNQH